MSGKENQSILLLIPLLFLLLLTACQDVAADGNSTAPSPIPATLTYATLSADSVDWDSIRIFNKTHPAIQIEVKDYSVYNEGEGSMHRGLERLLAEMTSGQIPDIFDFGGGSDSLGRLPYQQLVKKGYLEDLWPYIEKDPDLGRERLMEAPLKAAEVNGGLYMVFEKVWINTVLGPERLVGNRYSWTLDQLMDTFASMPEGATILQYFCDKKDIFRLSANVDNYIDWVTGQCNFDCDSFRSVLEFSNSFPLKFERPSNEDIDSEVINRIQSGLQMAEFVHLMNFTSIAHYEYIWGEDVSFVGYPTEDGSVGSQFYPYGGKLAMSSSCKNKEAAWELIRQVVLPKYHVTPKQVMETEISDREYLHIDLFGFPINCADFEVLKAYELSMPYSEEGAKIFAERGWVYDPTVTANQCERLLAFYNTIDKLIVDEPVIYNIVIDQCDAYFYGDRSLDDTIDQIQRRVTLYMNEIK